MNHNNHTTKEEIIYTCPMHPEVRKTEPCKCPGCGMDLIPLDKAQGKSEKKSVNVHAGHDMQKMPARQSHGDGGSHIE